MRLAVCTGVIKMDFIIFDGNSNLDLKLRPLMESVVIHPALALVATIRNAVDFRSNHLLGRIEEEFDMLAKAFNPITLEQR